jgi:hypothetical protein
MKLRLFKRVDKGTLVLLIVFLAAFPLLFKPWVHGFDTVAYYSWLRSTVIDGNLNVGNEFAHYGYGEERGTTATGYTDSEWAVGSAILWSPFFLIAHGVSLLARTLGLPVTTDGYAAQYVWAASLGSATYAFVGILLTYRLCRELFAPAIGVLATAAVWLSSPLLFYMYSHPLMSHANDAFAYALYIFTWYHTRRQQNWRGAALRGAAAGLCTLVRQVNAVLVIFALAEFVADGIRAWRSTRRAAELWPILLRMAAFSAAWWLAYLPQVIVWRVVSGHWIQLNPYSGRYSLNWLHPHLLGVLFSTDRGVFTWSPLLLLAAVGWVHLWKKERRLAMLLVSGFLLQFYIVASWDSWNGAISFGHRMFTNLAVSFALGLAALLTILHRRVPLGWLIAGCACFVGWNSLLLVRYVLEDIPRSGPVPLRNLIIGQFTVLPRYLHRIIQILLKRS